MNTKLNIDIPKGYNDMSRGELAQLSVNLKKLVADLNFVLTQLDEQNLTKAFKARLENIQKTAENTSKAYNEYMKSIFHVLLTDSEQSFTTDVSVDGKAIMIIPDAEYDYQFKLRGICISEASGNRVTLRASTPDYDYPAKLGFTVVLI